MDPATLAVATIGSSVVSGLGAIQQGKAAAGAAGYNASVAANNAQIATQNADFSGAVGNQNVGESEAKTRAQVGATLANQGASGVNVNTGSAVDVRESEAKIGMLNALNIRSEAARQAYGYQSQASNDIGQEGLYKSEAKNDISGSYLNAASTVLGGVGKAAQYGNFLSQGDPTGGITTGPHAADVGLGGLY